MTSPRALLGLICVCLLPRICPAQVSGSALDSQLNLAAYRGDIQAVKQLVAQGANVNTPGLLGGPPLQSAASQGHLVVVQFLIEHGADPNITAFMDGTALMTAAGGGRSDIVEYLLDHGANPKVWTFSGYDALTTAASQDDPDVVRVLLDHGVLVDATDFKNRTALIVAASGNNSRVVKFLLDRGAKVDTRGPDGRTALMLAAEPGYSDVVTLLLNHGADANISDADLLTALDYATRQNRANVVQLLQGRTDPRTVLQDAVVWLQQNTLNDHLRERIIEKALELNPGPVIPDEAKRHFGIGTDAMQHADSLYYETAEREFHEATNIAPWYAIAYYKAAIATSKMVDILVADNVATASDESYNYASAAKDMKFYLLAAPNASDLQQAKAFQEELESKSNAAHP